MKKPEPYDEQKCKNCVWKVKCDEGHFVCLFAKCQRVDAKDKKHAK